MFCKKKKTTTAAVDIEAYNLCMIYIHELQPAMYSSLSFFLSLSLPLPLWPSLFLSIHLSFHTGHIQGCMTPVSDVLGDMSCI